MPHPLARDLDHVLSHTKGVWEPLRGNSVFITGGTGFVGTWLTESLLWANDSLGLDVQLTLLSRDPDGFRARAPHLAGHASVALLAGDVSNFAFPRGTFPFVIHAATARQFEPTQVSPAGAFDADIEGTRRVLEFAATHGTERLLFTSSGAIYGKQPTTLTHVPEEYPGAPLPSEPNSAYGQAKRVSEWLCTTYGRQYGFAAVIARLFAFVGPRLPLDANFAVGNFIRDVLSGGPIRISGDGTPYRSYLYAADLAIWLWTLLLRGESAHPYNVGSGEALSIAELAEQVVAATKPGVPIEVARQAIPGAPAARYVPSVERAKTEFGLTPIISIEEGIRRTYEWHLAQASSQIAAAAPAGSSARVSSHQTASPSSSKPSQAAVRMRVADYIAKTVADLGVKQVFLVTGGGAMHLNDAFGREPRLRYVCTHHEQAAAMAAEGYARVSGRPAVVNVTTGPGAINSLNGVFGAWTDSIPMLVISGQVKRETCMATAGTRDLRQLGDQEADILSMVRGITKYAVLLRDPKSVRYHVERALYLSTHGRQGPCWIDVPVDVQGAEIEPDRLEGYDPVQDELRWDRAEMEKQCRGVLEKIAKAKRPVILAGSGVRLAGAMEEFRGVAQRLRIPVTTAWTHDLISTDDELFCGRPGTIGERPGNFTVQNADLVLILGSRLNIRQVSYNWGSFAPKAFKIQVDVDAAELHKPTVKPDLGIVCDLKLFLATMLEQLPATGLSTDHSCWLAWCRERVKKYPAVQPRQRAGGPPLNPYYFIEMLGQRLADDDVIVCGNASACIVPFQVMPLKKQQRMFSNSGAASMGYDLPAAVGAACARGGGRVICFAGDGSIQMNIQELQTVVHHQLPVKIFVLNNNGYLSMRLTQGNFFGRLIGESRTSGVSFPDMVKVAAAYGIRAMRIDRAGQIDDVVKKMAESGPLLVDVVLDPAQEFEPRIKSRRLDDGTILTPALDDMYPFLDPEELAANRFPDEE